MAARPPGHHAVWLVAGRHRDSNTLLSATYRDTGARTEYGACLYERGLPNVTFIDLTGRLSGTETLFSDPKGQDLRASITDVDTEGRSFVVDVYDTTKKESEDRYTRTRSIEVSY